MITQIVLSLVIMPAEMMLYNAFRALLRLSQSLGTVPYLIAGFYGLSTHLYQHVCTYPGGWVFSVTRLGFYVTQKNHASMAPGWLTVRDTMGSRSMIWIGNTTALGYVHTTSERIGAFGNFTMKGKTRWSSFASSI
jgi:hypothetical protein